MKSKRPAPTIRVKDIPPGPPGLAGYCWLQDPETGVHCCEPVGHETRYRQHHNPYHNRRW